MQGVYYRQSARQKAIELGITGVVQNKADGSVYITATGKNEQLLQFIQWCEKGPVKAIVSQVITEPLVLQSFVSFEIIHS